MVSSQRTAISTSRVTGCNTLADSLDKCRHWLPPNWRGQRAGVVGNNVIPNCNSYPSSDQEVASNFVETVSPAGAGTTSGMLGYMFWGGGCQGTAEPFAPSSPDTCEGGVGAGATALNVPIPMPALRQN